MEEEFLLRLQVKLSTFAVVLMLSTYCAEG